MYVSAETFAHADCVSSPVGSSSESTALAAPATKQNIWWRIKKSIHAL
jgi:hypothetical protein